MNRPGPVERSLGTAFAALSLAVAAMALTWAASNCRIVPPDSRAVVSRFGAVVDVRGSGLALAWPRPIGRVDLAPGAERLLAIDSATTLRAAGLVDGVTEAEGVKLPDGAGAYLTGDGGVVLLRARISYLVSDPAAYVVAEAHVVSALQRAFSASAVRVLAARSLDDVMVAEPVRPGDGGSERAVRAMAAREALRGDLAAAMNDRLARLGLGVTVARIDPEPSLPPQAKTAYDQVLVAAQMAEQGLADARTASVQATQSAAREADRLIEAAKAAAAERVGQAQAQAAPILAVQASLRPGSRLAVLDRLYRDQLAALLPKVGRLVAVDPSGGSRVILPGGSPTGGAP